MKVVSVAGYHHTGKTTTAVQLIKELKKRGYKVVSIKDIHAESFSMEKPDSNTWKHWEASGGVVFARGLKETYQIWHNQLSLKEMLEHLKADYVVVEGMKSAALPRILCAKDKAQLDELRNGSVFAVSGIYADKFTEYEDLPVISSLNNIEQLADLVEKKVFPVLPLADPECCSACGVDCHGMVEEILSGRKVRNDCKTDRKTGLKIEINDKPVKIVPFVQNILQDVILALTRNLKGCEKGKVSITIDE